MRRKTLIYLIYISGSLFTIYLAVKLHFLLSIYSLCFLVPLFLDIRERYRSFMERRRREREAKEWEEAKRRAIRKFEEMREKYRMVNKPIEWRKVDFPEIKIERTGEILRRLGIKRLKIRKQKLKKEIKLKPIKPRKEKLSTLEPLIEELMEKGELEFSRNMHYGKLRGKDIAKALAKELKRRNIKFQLELDDYDAKIRIR